ncbi:MAG: hypothetical protein H0X40_08655 [Chthoniobacterales bacterium]|nr:hypothetical protein [Chthoniobacterales bacterium]
MKKSKKYLMAAVFLTTAFPRSMPGLPISGDTPRPSPDAVTELARLTEVANTARKSGDLQARLQAILAVQKLVNDAPNSIAAAARAYAEVGNSQQVIAALSRFADLGQADDGLVSKESKTFAAIKALPQDESILKRFAANKTPISQAETAFSLPGSILLPEDIDYDPKSKSFLVTSVLGKKISRVNEEGKATDFAESPSHWPMFGLKLDPARRLLWATEVALEGFNVAPKADWGRSVVLCFDLDTGKMKQRIEGPAHTALGDMKLTLQGDPIVSDGKGGGIYRVSHDRLERIDGGDYISPQTGVMHPDGKRLFVPDYVRGVSILDPATKHVTWLDQGAHRDHALNGIDGLYLYHNYLIATQNGTSPERVICFGLDSSLARVNSERIIERATATLGDPTHGVIAGDFFYYIANSGWDKVDEHGDLKQNSKFTPAHIMRFRLAKLR